MTATIEPMPASIDVPGAAKAGVRVFGWQVSWSATILDFGFSGYSPRARWRNDSYWKTGRRWHRSYGYST